MLDKLKIIFYYPFEGGDDREMKEIIKMEGWTIKVCNNLVDSDKDDESDKDGEIIVVYILKIVEEIKKFLIQLKNVDLFKEKEIKEIIIAPVTTPTKIIETKKAIICREIKKRGGLGMLFLFSEKDYDFSCECKGIMCFQNCISLEEK